MDQKSRITERESKPATNARQSHEPSQAGQPIPNHPLADVIGAFQDDPMLDAMMENIYEYRRQLEREAEIAEQAGVPPR